MVEFQTRNEQEPEGFKVSRGGVRVGRSQKSETRMQNPESLEKRRSTTVGGSRIGA